MSLLSKLFSKPSQEEVIRFNYEFNFNIVPELVKEYNHNNSLDTAILTDFRVPKSTSKPVEALYRKLKTVESGINGHPGISLILLEMPNSGMISEVEIGMLAVNKNLHHAVYFTMEYCLGNYMMCVTDEKGHGSIMEVQDREQFCFEVFKSAMRYWDTLESARNPTAIF